MIMKNNRFIGFLLKRYGGRLSVVFLFSLLSVALSIFVFMMIEPFCKILFRGELSDLSPISALFISLIGRFVNVDSLVRSVSLLLALALLFYFLKNLFGYASQWVMARMRSDLLFTLRNLLYDKILRLPIGYFSQQKRGDVVSRAVNDTHEIEHTILNALKQFITEPISAALYLVALFYISPKLSVYAILLLPVTFFLIGKISRSLRRSARDSKKRLGTLLSHTEETLSGLRIIKGFNSQVNAEQIFNKLNQNFADTQKKIYRKVELASPVSEFLGVTVVMIILVIGGAMVLNDDSALSAELFITYIALFTQIITPIKNISAAFSNFKRGQAALDRIGEVLSADEVICQPGNPVPVQGFKTDIVLDNLSFAYDKNEVLSNISLTIPKGSCVALVGQSGAGKTTIADLLERFYDPTAGCIKLDGVDIRDYDIAGYRSLFSLVSQDVVLFNDTLYNNIAMGLPDVSDEDLIRAAKVANIYDFIQTLPDGFQHQLSDRGLNLSGGQRQRISIARAVLHNTPIIILDEATSAMDTESERLVQQALDNVMQNRTVVVIAHRLLTIQGADNIVVLDKGKIVEQGSHQQLIAQGGLYNKLIQIQQFK